MLEAAELETYSNILWFLRLLKKNVIYITKPLHLKFWNLLTCIYTLLE